MILVLFCAGPWVTSSVEPITSAAVAGLRPGPLALSTATLVDGLMNVTSYTSPFWATLTSLIPAPARPFKAFSIATAGALKASGTVGPNVPYVSVKRPAIALTVMSWTVLLVPGTGKATTLARLLASIVTVAAVAALPGVEERMLPIGGVSLISAGSITGWRSSKPVRSVPTPPLMKSGP